jgi:uncharacterized protein YndB with AHSA1/START domain
MSIVHADFTIERQYDQTPAQTYSGFADQRLKRRWFAIPEDAKEARYELDFRVGGSELNQGAPGGGETVFTFRARYHEIAPEQRIVFVYDLLADDKLMSVSLTTVEFFAAEAGTRLVFTEYGAFFDGLDEPAEREHGNGILLGQLGEALSTEFAA